MFWKVGSSATLGTGTCPGRQHPGADVDLDERRRHAARPGARAQRRRDADRRHDHRRALRDRRRRGRSGAGGLDVAAALPADPGIGANQHLWPNRAVEAALVQAGLDPTRANWTKGTWGSNAWAKGTWGKGTWGKGTWGAAHRGVAP